MWFVDFFIFNWLSLIDLGSGGHFENTYECLNLRVLKCSCMNTHLSTHGQDILCGISKGTFEIPHKISCPYIEKYNFYTLLKFEEFLDLRAHRPFWNAPQVIVHCLISTKPLTNKWYINTPDWNNLVERFLGVFKYNWISNCKHFI